MFPRNTNWLHGKSTVADFQTPSKAIPISGHSVNKLGGKVLGFQHREIESTTLVTL
jgi:hypothetical protein